MVPSVEVVQFLHRVVNGDVAVSLANPDEPWSSIGNIAFMFGYWRITFFNDCDELDYIDNVTCPNDRTACFDDWHDECGCCPLDFLTERDRTTLERILQQAK